MKKVFADWRDLSALAREHNFVVTSTNGGRHNKNSKHFRGLAIDVRTRDKSDAEINAFVSLCRSHGLIVRDERTRPAGQKIWTGAHLHIEI